ncbi:MAG: hypothetical protein CM1200mP28_05920 [Deltaproteobacteria bacterium]|nr:MAG: hypothetical protein CM1200mP28_05920 [Deltaproteobacteria bacterium]
MLPYVRINGIRRFCGETSFPVDPANSFRFPVLKLQASMMNELKKELASTVKIAQVLTIFPSGGTIPPINRQIPLGFVLQTDEIRFFSPILLAHSKNPKAGIKHLLFLKAC